MSADTIDQSFQDALQGKVFSGAQVLVGKNRKTLFHGTYGKLSEAPDAPGVEEASLFDIASLTKPIATTGLMMLAVQEKKVSLQDPVKKILPFFQGTGKITMENLLAHTSGLPPWLALYKKVQGKNFSREEIKQSFTSQISEVALESAPGKKRVYSDLGFILLGFVLEEIYRESLDVLFRERISRPLKMTLTFFNPLGEPANLPESKIAAIENTEGRPGMLRGEVHDDNAFALEGVAGHAGLFAPAQDLEKFIHSLWEGLEGSESVIPSAILQEFLGDNRVPKLGWDTVSPEKSQAGRYFSTRSIGHLAFSGCSLWMDLQDQKYIVLLTNRHRPHRENESLKEFRPKIHDQLIQALDLV